MAKLNRLKIQIISTLITNFKLDNFFSGKIYKGFTKNLCSPGLNCYSCPAAGFACPIGAMQAVSGGRKFNIPFYVFGFLMSIGIIFGRMVCGFLCPFGLIQDLLNKLSKINLKIPKFFKYIKYIMLIFLVLILPIIYSTDILLADPYYCKYVCPAGILEGAFPLIMTNKNLKSALGNLFYIKSITLALIIFLSIIIYRPFCKVLCPLGAFYAFFNKISIIKLELDESKCISCNKCNNVCKMDVEFTKNQNALECIRCNECKNICPTNAITIKRK
ncbi:4Fe-4S binding protein [Peptostreptococcaceae bacterium AGR-M142]